MAAKKGKGRGGRPETAVFGPRLSAAIAGERMRQWLRANPRPAVDAAHRAARDIAVWVVGKVDSDLLMPGLEEHLDRYFAAIERIYPPARPVVSCDTSGLGGPRPRGTRPTRASGAFDLPAPPSAEDDL